MLMVLDFRHVSRYTISEISSFGSLYMLQPFTLFFTMVNLDYLTFAFAGAFCSAFTSFAALVSSPPSLFMFLSLFWFLIVFYTRVVSFLGFSTSLK
jgi:hypothetical protein